MDYRAEKIKGLSFAEKEKLLIDLGHRLLGMDIKLEITPQIILKA